MNLLRSLVRSHYTGGSPDHCLPERRPNLMARRPGLPDLFRHWEEVARRARAAKQILLFIDFDGTLVDFCPRPEQVRLRGTARRALRRLVRKRALRVIIVSGRRRSVLMRLLRVPRIECMGLYGWEDGPRRRLPRRAAEQIARLRSALTHLPEQIPGVWVEDKGMSLNIHHRGTTASAQRRARARLRAILARFGGQVRVLRTRDAWDVVPREIEGKGSAIEKVLAAAPASALPIYLGDDWTDEPAFAALRGGISVLVGPARATRARFRLRNTEEVCQFIERLDKELP